MELTLESRKLCGTATVKSWSYAETSESGGKTSNEVMDPLTAGSLLGYSCVCIDIYVYMELAAPPSFAGGVLLLSAVAIPLDAEAVTAFLLSSHFFTFCYIVSCCLSVLWWSEAAALVKVVSVTAAVV